MRSQSRFLLLVSLMVFFGSVCYGATITGAVKGTEGAPFQGAFVEAQNTKTRITVIVLSDSHWQYRIEKLPAGEYRLQIRAVGFRTDPKTGVNLTADQKASYDFALQKGMVHWNDISFYQARQLWPAARGKDLIVANCSTCHLFQTRMASVTRDEDGWRDRVEYMRTTMHVGRLLHIYDIHRVAAEGTHRVLVSRHVLWGFRQHRFRTEQTRQVRG